jgi:hypothetical protein
MATYGGLIDARLLVEHSYRSGNRFDGAVLADLLGGTNNGPTTIHLNLGRERLDDREHERRERERRERERRRRRRERRRYEELRGEIRHLFCVVILLIIILWRA